MSSNCVLWQTVNRLHAVNIILKHNCYPLPTSSYTNIDAYNNCVVNFTTFNFLCICRCFPHKEVMEISLRLDGQKFTTLGGVRWKFFKNNMCFRGPRRVLETKLIKGLAVVPKFWNWAIPPLLLWVKNTDRSSMEAWDSW